VEKRRGKNRLFILGKDIPPITETPLNFARQAGSPPPLPFSSYTIHLVVFIYFFREQKGGIFNKNHGKERY
jgi:hypothetical protein